MTGEIENARIDAVSLTMADHGCITYWISLSGNGTVQKLTQRHGGRPQKKEVE